MKKRRSAPPAVTLCLSGTLLFMFLPSGCSRPEGKGREFYRGKTLRILTSNSPGGGFDFYMRLTAKHVEEVEQLAVAAQNVEGAGGTLGDNKLFHSRADGLTIGLINAPGHIFAQLRNHPGVRYDFRKWKWLGRVAGIPPAIAVSPQSQFQTVDDLLNTERPLRFGLEGRGSDAFYGTVLLSRALDLSLEQIVGYSGPGEIAGAMLAGEIDARFESIDTLIPSVRQGELRLLLVLDRERDARVPEVTAISEIAASEETRAMLRAYTGIYQLERSFVAPPGTPKQRVSYLRDLLWRVWNSEGFRHDVEAAGRGLQPLHGDRLEDEALKVAEQVNALAGTLAD